MSAQVPLLDVPVRKLSFTYCTPLKDIEEAEGFNPRTDYGEDDGTFAALVESIRLRGILQPPLLRPLNLDKYGNYDGDNIKWAIVAGHRRIAAAREAGLTELEVAAVHDAGIDITLDKKKDEALKAESLAAYTEADRLLDALTENNHRKSLNAIEEARAFVRLTEMGLSQDAIGKASGGKGQAHVSRTLKLLSLPELVVSRIAAGSLSRGQAEELLPLLTALVPEPSIIALASGAAEGDWRCAAVRGHVKTISLREGAERPLPEAPALFEMPAMEPVKKGDEAKDAAPHTPATEATAPVRADERGAPIRHEAPTRGESDTRHTVENQKANAEAEETLSRMGSSYGQGGYSHASAESLRLWGEKHFGGVGTLGLLSELVKPLPGGMDDPKKALETHKRDLWAAKENLSWAVGSFGSLAEALAQLKQLTEALSAGELLTVEDAKLYQSVTTVPEPAASPDLSLALSPLSWDLLAVVAAPDTSNTDRIEDILAGWARSQGIDVKSIIEARAEMEAGLDGLKQVAPPVEEIATDSNVEKLSLTSGQENLPASKPFSFPTSHSRVLAEAEDLAFGEYMTVALFSGVLAPNHLRNLQGRNEKETRQYARMRVCDLLEIVPTREPTAQEWKAAAQFHEGKLSIEPSPFDDRSLPRFHQEVLDALRGIHADEAAMAMELTYGGVIDLVSKKNTGMSAHLHSTNGWSGHEWNGASKPRLELLWHRKQPDGNTADNKRLTLSGKTLYAAIKAAIEWKRGQV